MTKLTALDLGGCTGITDKGLECLATKTNWQTIMLGGCAKVTGDAVSKLQRALPNAKVAKMRENGAFTNDAAPRDPRQRSSQDESI
jgi:hypothetical protein